MARTDQRLFRTAQPAPRADAPAQPEAACHGPAISTDTLHRKSVQSQRRVPAEKNAG